MRKNLAAGLVAVAALSLAAPPAAAGHEIVTCRLHAVTVNSLTAPGVWEGVATGTIVSSATQPVAVRCVVKVSNVVRYATTWGTGTGAASVSDRATWVAAPTDPMQLCAQYVGGHGPGQTCSPVSVAPTANGEWLATA